MCVPGVGEDDLGVVLGQRLEELQQLRFGAQELARVAPDVPPVCLCGYIESGSPPAAIGPIPPINPPDTPNLLTVHAVEGVALGAEAALGLVPLVEQWPPDGLGGRGARDAQVLVHELEEPPDDVLPVAVVVGVERAVQVEEQHAAPRRMGSGSSGGGLRGVSVGFSEASVELMRCVGSFRHPGNRTPPHHARTMVVR